MWQHQDKGHSNKNINKLLTHRVGLDKMSRRDSKQKFTQQCLPNATIASLYHASGSQDSSDSRVSRRHVSRENADAPKHTSHQHGSKKCRRLLVVRCVSAGIVFVISMVSVAILPVCVSRCTAYLCYIGVASDRVNVD